MAVTRAITPRLKRRRLALGLSFALLAVLPTNAGAGGGGTRSLATGDGLAITLDSKGKIDDLSVGARSLPKTPSGGGFSLRVAGGRPNLLGNAGFEADRDGDDQPDGWTLTSGASSPVLARKVAHSGNRSIRLRNPERANSGIVWREVPVGANTSYFACGWFKSRKLKPNAPTAFTPTELSPFRLKVQQFSSSGELVRTANAFGYTGTAGWNKQCVGIKTTSEVTKVRIVGQLVEGSGTAWLDDMYLGRLFGPSKNVRGSVTTGDSGRLEQRGGVPSKDLAVEATFAERSDHIRVDGVIKSRGRPDRAVELTYTLPIDAEGWSWGDYARDSRTIGEGKYTNETTSSSQPMSRYPFGTIYDAESLVGLGIPLGDPRVTRIDYKAGVGLSISFDLGMSRAAKTMGPEASFSFVIYTGDQNWGFRAATQKYYDIFPKSFKRRTEPAREGIWFRKAPLSQLDTTYEDFGLGLNVVALGRHSDQSHSTWGTDYLPWDNARGIYGAAYNHHWVFRGEPKAGQPRTYKSEIRHLKSIANSEPTTYDERRKRDEAIAALRSTARDLNGRLYYEIYRTLPSFYESLDALRSSSRDNDWESAVRKYQVQHAFDLAQGVEARLDAIHLDSTSGMRRWAATDNYYRKHWAATRIPLTFSFDSGRVSERLMFPIYMHIKRLSHWLHARGRILSANFNASEARAGGWIGANKIDYFGIERSLTDKTAGDPYVTLDSFAMLKRTVAYQRPVSTLDSPQDAEVSVEELEERLRLNLFYGIFSGVGGGGAWGDERRSVYAEYTPLFRQLASAGWEPITYARSSNPDVWLERFGRIGDDNLQFTVRNETETEQVYTATVDLSAHVACEATAAQAEEAISDTPVPVVVDTSSDEATFGMPISAKDTQLIRLEVTGEGCGET